jgi:very-short-patch-repair endonuclease
MRAIRTEAKIRAARRLRKSLTKPELWLWLRLRDCRKDGLAFRNQHPIGPYILDFYCAKARLCIEVDGEIHTREPQRAYDAVRDAWLTNQGIYVHRVHAVDLLAAPDETALGIIGLALQRAAGVAKTPPTAFGGPPSP